MKSVVVFRATRAKRSGSARQFLARAVVRAAPFALLAIVVFVVNGPLVAQWANYATPHIPRTADGKPNLTAPAPRTADGKPDLSGLWNKISPKYGNNITGGLQTRGGSAFGAKLWSSSATKTWVRTT